jgi:hypothetical protein
VATVGIYQVYWFYKNWKRVQELTGEALWPVPRGIFSIFFAHSLFRRVDAKLATLGNPFRWSASTTATLYVVLAILSNFLDRLAGRSLGSPWTDFASILFVPVLALVLLPAQRAINFAAEDPGGASNSNLTLANFVWLAVGALIWLLIAAGVLMELGVIPSE